MIQRCPAAFSKNPLASGGFFYARANLPPKYALWRHVFPTLRNYQDDGIASETNRLTAPPTKQQAK